MWKDCYLALDTETSGFGKHARILELGLVYFERGVPVQEWHRILNPPGMDWNHPDVVEACEINGLSKEYCSKGVSFSDVVVELIVWLDEPVWVGHCLDFDVRMLKQEFYMCGQDWDLKPSLELCTRNLAFKLEGIVGGNKLEDVAPRWGIKQAFAHSAIDDAKVSGQILAKMIAKGGLPSELGPMDTMKKEAASAWHRRSKGR